VTVEQQNKWEGVGNIRRQIVGVTLLLLPSLGTIVSLETIADYDKNIYQITVDMFSTYVCPNFVNMAVPTIGG